MKHGHRFFSLLLALLLGLSLCAFTVTADGLSTDGKAAALTELGLFKGKADARGNVTPALGDAATRAEAATMVTRLMGREQEALEQYASGALTCVFTDVPDWAAPYVSWLNRAGMVNGTGGTSFTPNQIVTAQQYCAMVLRALGYNETKGDFQYAQALEAAVSKGLLTEAQRSAWSGSFLRDGMVEISFNALEVVMGGSALTLREKLAQDGVIAPDAVSHATPRQAAPISSLTLSERYTAGGRTNPTYFEEKAYGSAVCGDVDGDGRMEIVYGIRSILCIDAATGELEWRVPCGHDITEGLNPALDYAGEAYDYAPPFRLLDYDGDGLLDIFTVTNQYGTSRCDIAVYDGSGRYKVHWTTERRVWAACVDDFDGDGSYEVAVGYGVGKEGMNGVPSIFLYNHDGSVRWKKPCAYGMYSDSMTALDLDGDGKKELLLLFDDNGVVAYHADGSEVTTPAFDGKKWSEILLYEGVDGHVYPHTSRDDTIGLMGTHSGLISDDLDGDGKKELVGVGMFVQMGVVENNMANDAGVSFDDSAEYFSVFILNADRTRYQNAEKGYDWSRFPIDVGKLFTPLDSDVIANPVVRPVTADVRGDGDKEILYSSYDGKLHCFSLDGEEHGSWPFDLNTGRVRVYATEPVAADFNGDGKSEVVFATYTQTDQTAVRGSLYILDGDGKVLAQTLLPVMFAQSADISYPNGSQAAPIVADMDGDGDLEIGVATYSCGMCVYDVS